MISATKAMDLVEIVEGLKGSLEHGAWRNEHGMRLKDTPEWAAFYVATKDRHRQTLCMVPDGECLDCSGECTMNCSSAILTTTPEEGGA